MPRLSNTHTVQITSGPGTQLASIASGMTSGQWLQLTSSNLPSGLGLFTNQGGVSGITGYVTKMVRDPTNHKFYYIGGDHVAPDIFLRFDENTHTWVAAASGVPFGPQSGGTTPCHGYEHNIFDTNRGKIWHRPFNEQGMRRWESGTTWTSFTYFGSLNAITAGCCYFPELDRIILFQGNGNVSQGMCFGVDPGNPTATPTTYANPIGTAQWYHCAHYSPQHQRVVLVGGTSDAGSNTKVWTLNSSGVITQLSGDRPSALGMIGPGEAGISMPFINPSNGHLVCIKNSSTWYECNILTGVWTAKSGTVGVMTGSLYSSGEPFGVFACPIFESGYGTGGVVAFIKGYSRTSPADMWLWKP